MSNRANSQDWHTIQELRARVTALEGTVATLRDVIDDALVVGLDYGTNNFSDAEVRGREDALRAALQETP